jgi:predicted lactoylglutathione lyase
MRCRLLFLLKIIQKTLGALQNKSLLHQCILPKENLKQLFFVYDESVDDGRYVKVHKDAFLQACGPQRCCLLYYFAREDWDIKREEGSGHPTASCMTGSLDIARSSARYLSFRKHHNAFILHELSRSVHVFADKGDFKTEEHLARIVPGSLCKEILANFSYAFSVEKKGGRRICRMMFGRRENPPVGEVVTQDTTSQRMNVESWRSVFLFLLNSEEFQNLVFKHKKSRVESPAAKALLERLRLFMLGEGDRMPRVPTVRVTVDPDAMIREVLSALAADKEEDVKAMFSHTYSFGGTCLVCKKGEVSGTRSEYLLGLSYAYHRLLRHGIYYFDADTATPFKLVVNASCTIGDLKERLRLLGFTEEVLLLRCTEQKEIRLITGTKT